MMNDRITIQKPPEGNGALRPPPGAWNDVAAVWADMRFPSGAEVIRGGLTTNVVQASARVRTRVDVDATMRLVHKGVTYNIQSVLPDSKDRRFMFLVCDAAK